jgi:Uma2 family endonuclease
MGVSKPARRITWDDIKDLPPDDKRWEILDGELFLTSSPNWRHQKIVLRFAIALDAHVEVHGLGEVTIAPMDSILDPYNVVEPDILYISNERRGIIGERVHGAPDLCVEVLSPSTAVRDRGLKRTVYAKFGVREYWIVDPEVGSVEVFAGPGLDPFAAYQARDRLRSTILPDLDLPLAPIFV